MGNKIAKMQEELADALENQAKLASEVKEHIGNLDNRISDLAHLKDQLLVYTSIVKQLRTAKVVSLPEWRKTLHDKLQSGLKIKNMGIRIEIVEVMLSETKERLSEVTRKVERLTKELKQYGKVLLFKEE